MEIGDRVRDRVSKFEGIVTGMTEYINGCRQFLIEPEQTDNGKRIDGAWIDEQKLELVAHGIFANPFETAKLAEMRPATAGGPTSTRRQGE